MTNPPPSRAPAFWPFASSEQAANYEALRTKGYAILREAHVLWTAAIEQRRAKP